jgi:hypothetical protein
MNKTLWSAQIAWLIWMAFYAMGGRAENIIFPQVAGVVDARRDYGAKGDGQSDDTAAIQKAITENYGNIVYLPNGVYLLSDTLIWPKGEKRMTLWGQSRDGAILKLKDNCPGYTDAQQPKAMIWTGRKPAQRFSNYVRNLTFDTGKGNAGAIGAQYMANNTGSFRDVLIRSGDGKGVIGLDLGYTDEQGPCLIKNVEVVGFDVGISARYAVDSIVLENITLRNQNVVGFRNNGQCVSMRSLKSANAVTAVENSGSALLVLLDSELRAISDVSTKPAIINAKPAALFARNVAAEGYASAITNDSGEAQGVKGATVTEFVSHSILSAFPSPAHSLHLPVKETPEVGWGDLKDWASVVDFGAQPRKQGAGGGGRSMPSDCTAAFQKAIDSGARTIHFPRGYYSIEGTVIVRGKVERLIGLGHNAEIGGTGKFEIADGIAPVVVFEHLTGTGTGILHTSKWTLVIRHMALQVMGRQAIYTGTDGCGDLFIEDIVCKGLRIKKQNVWARQLNTEPPTTKVENDGGTFWLLGLKCERHGTLVNSINGAKTEVLGGFEYTTTDPGESCMFVTRDSALSFSIGEANFSRQHGSYPTLLRETCDGQTRALNSSAVPKRTNGALVALCVAYPQSGSISVPLTQPRDFVEIPAAQVTEIPKVEIQLPQRPQPPKSSAKSERPPREGPAPGSRKDAKMPQPSPPPKNFKPIDPETVSNRGDIELKNPILISTADGRGADAMVRGGDEANHGNEPSMVLLNQPRSGRKAYIRFDLASAKTPIKSAIFYLTVVPNTGKNQATFNVFGLNDGDPGENWIEGNGGSDNNPEGEIIYSNAPGNVREGGGKHNLATRIGGGGDPARTTFLGTLTIENSDYALNHKKNGVAFSTPALVEFLSRDTNRLVTFIITREKVSQTDITSFGTKEGKDAAPTLALSAE